MSDNEEAQKAEEQLSENEKVLGWLFNHATTQPALYRIDYI